VNVIRVHVKNGRIVVDEPTELPDGAELKLWIVEGDELGDGDHDIPR
jgi:hypothetical protein